MEIDCLFRIKDKVYIDKGDIIGTISAILLREDGLNSYIQYEVEWMHNGTNQSVWIAGYRLAKCREELR